MAEFLSIQCHEKARRNLTKETSLAKVWEGKCLNDSSTTPRKSL